MININNKNWDQLNYSDIKEWLRNTRDADGQENFFFEFKSDGVSNHSFIKEVSALSNTYGGYILIGVDDDGNMSGCKGWNEERIYSTLYNGITPLPNFDVKTFKDNGTDDPVIVVRIEQGPVPPYITNKGCIYERVSSGSIPIKDSSKLLQLYKRHADYMVSIAKEIELPDIIFDEVPNNIFGYIDLGFHVEFSDQSYIRKRWLDIGSSRIIDFIKSSPNEVSISKVGDAYCINTGKTEAKDSYGNVLPIQAGANNFIEISINGSVRSRILLRSDPGETTINLALVESFHKNYESIYNQLFGEDFAKTFLYARKYEKITVLKQFVPMYEYDSDTEMGSILNKYLDEHIDKYGNNLVIEGNRIPADGYTLIDKQYIDNLGWEYSDKGIIEALFSSQYFNLGFIDPPTEMEELIEERLKN